MHRLLSSLNCTSLRHVHQLRYSNRYNRGYRSALSKSKTSQPESSSVLDSINDDHEAEEYSEFTKMFRIRPAISKEEDEELEDLTASDGYYHKDMDNDLTVDEDDEPNPMYRLGKILLERSRVHFRHIENLPSWYQQKHSDIVNYRSTAQIRRCLKSWMLDINNREINSKYITKDLYWRDDDADSKNSMNVKVYGPDDTVAYTHFFSPSRFAITKRICNELKLYLPSFKPERVIDFGCGPGTAGAAVFDVWREDTKKYTGIDMSRAMLDAARIMLENIPKNESASFNTKYNKSFDKKIDASKEEKQDFYKLDCTYWDKISDVVKRVDKTKERFDLGIISYTLTELTTDISKRAAVQVMFELLEVGGCLVIIESGNPVGSHAVRTARQFLLDSFSNPSLNHQKSKKSSNSPIELLLPSTGYTLDDVTAKVVAPCTHDNRCPLTKQNFCSFSQKVKSGVIRKSSEEKFSYVIIQKVPKVNSHDKSIKAGKYPPRSLDVLKQLDPWTTTPDSKIKANIASSNSSSDSAADDADSISNPSPREVLLQYLKCDSDTDASQLSEKLLDDVDWDEYNPPMRRQEWSRVIRSPLKAKGHITLDLCTPQGLISRSVFSRANVLQIPTLFVAIRKTTWGGLFPSEVNDESVNSLRGDEAVVELNKLLSETDLKDLDILSEDVFSNSNKRRREPILKKSDVTRKVNRNGDQSVNGYSPLTYKATPSKYGDKHAFSRLIPEDDDVDVDDDVADDTNRVKTRAITADGTRRSSGGIEAQSNTGRRKRNTLKTVSVGNSPIEWSQTGDFADRMQSDRVDSLSDKNPTSSDLSASRLRRTIQKAKMKRLQERAESSNE